MDKDFIEIKKTDSMKQIAFAEVYAPDMVDAHGDYMTAESIEKMAYEFMRELKLHKIDVNHDNQEYNCYIVESFIARKGDDTYIPGSWVVGIHVDDKDLWQKILDGEINGLSMEALAYKKESTIEMYCPVLLSGVTEKAEDGHVHKFSVFINEDGLFAGGTTDEVNGHKHEIITGTATEKVEDHTHRFSYLEGIMELGDEKEEN